MIIACIVLAIVGVLLILAAFAFDGEGWFIACGILSFIASGGFLIAAVERDSAKQRAAFMTECIQYRKQYECTVLWREGDPETVVVPVVVPVR